MKRFTLENKPDAWTYPYRKTGTIDVTFCEEPFEIDTQEGVMLISEETVDDWDKGYCVAYPSDGTKPYAISPKFLRKNYVPLE